MSRYVLTCPAEKRPTLRRSRVLTNHRAPPPLKWGSDMHPCFLSGSSNSVCLHCFSSSVFFFLLFEVGHFLALLLSSLLCHRLQLGLELEHLWPPGKSHLCGGGALPRMRCCHMVSREWLCLLRHFPRLWLVVLTHRQWPASYSTVRS